jgi:hypothetical protein
MLGGIDLGLGGAAEGNVGGVSAGKPADVHGAGELLFLAVGRAHLCFSSRSFAFRVAEMDARSSI